MNLNLFLLIALSSSVPVVGDSSDVVRRTVTEESYDVLWQVGTPLRGIPGGWQAPNRANRMRTFFVEDGIRVVPAASEHASWLFAARLFEMGRGGERCLVSAGDISVHDDTVEYARGAVSEWYLNDERGLEQGFTVRERPAGPESGKLELVVRWAGNLSARLDGGRVLFHEQDGDVALVYRDLFAFDATGRELDCTLSLEDHSIVLTVDDDAAVYPLAVDPLVAAQIDKLTASDADDFDFLGGSVAISGDFMVVGAVGDDDVCCESGSAYVFERVAGVWSQHTKLTASDAAAGDNFSTVDIDGNYIVVGARGNDDGGTDSGSAYVFFYDGASWSEQAILTAADDDAGDLFGDVAISGDSIIVGAKGDSDIASNAGSAYVFTRSGTVWSEQQKLTAFDAAGNDAFGSVDIDGDTACVGALGDDDDGLSSGSVYVYTRTAGVWSFQQKLTASDGETEDKFGESLGVSGNWLVIGACGDDDFGAPGDSGAAYLFERSGASWSEEEKLLASDADGLDLFGFSVAIDRDRVVIGAPNHDSTTPGRDSGAVYLWERFGKVWSEQSIMEPTGGDEGDLFGVAVDIDCQDVAIGAFFDDDPTAGVLAGSAYVFEVTPTNFTTFCFGDGGIDIDMDLMPDCTPCPCGNDVALTTGGCENGNGGSAILVGTGVPSEVSGSDTLRFEMTDGNPTTFGVLTSGDNQLPANAVNPCFGLATGVTAIQLDGLRCVGGSVLRHGSRATDASGDIGVSNNGWGPPNGPAGGLVAQGGWVCGQTRHFQVIYREMGALQCMTGQNTSNGVSVTIVP